MERENIKPNIDNNHIYKYIEMKYKYLCLLLFAALTATNASRAQNTYQLPNPGFEQWDGTAIDNEPSHWNSFATSDGSFASLASTPHHYRRDGGRPGTSGSSYLTIYTKSVMGVKANGNMTTGRIHAGSLIPSGDENYNYTQRSNADHCQPFTATPDSMYVWVSFYAGSASSEAQVEAVIHGSSNFRIPNDLSIASMYKARAVAKTTRTTSSPSQMQWQQLKVPFVYEGGSTAAYILINITTNKNPGEGSANDSLSVDDIEFIYSAWLTDIRYKGTSLEGFDKGRFDYSIHLESLDDLNLSDFAVVTEAGDAMAVKSEEQTNDTTVTVTITVTAEDRVTVKEYHIAMTTGTPQEPPVATEPSPQSPAVKAYPNPAGDYVTVEAEGTVRVCDLRGRVYAECEVHGSNRIDTSNWPRGVYVLESQNSKVKIIKK